MRTREIIAADVAMTARREAHELAILLESDGLARLAVLHALNDARVALVKEWAASGWLPEGERA